MCDDCYMLIKCKVEALGEIEVATKLLEDNAGAQDDPLFSCYERLSCELTPVEVDSKEYHMIAKYMKNTHAKTHTNYGVEIVQIFRTSRHEKLIVSARF
ncbi:putative NAD(+) ADP-ribosyltransferase [Helianthus annuus]|nr:putative NAD(+) ADP-ribosyltransferase [Helianthus annuus]